MELGSFSISLNVKNIESSASFYKKLGFTEFGGNIEEKWLILKNGDHIIGLFEGMFESNIMTFNPGWNQNAEQLESFTDVREIQKKLLDEGVELSAKVQTESGPAHIQLTDPDGNVILIDQHC